MKPVIEYLLHPPHPSFWAAGTWFSEERYDNIIHRWPEAVLLKTRHAFWCRCEECGTNSHAIIIK